MAIVVVATTKREENFTTVGRYLNHAKIDAKPRRVYGHGRERPAIPLQHSQPSDESRGGQFSRRRMMKTADDYLSMAVDLAFQNVREHGGRPFGAVLVRNGTVLATGVNDTVATHDPSAHAEMQAIRVASQLLRNPRLDGCVIYASGHPCPMCLAAMHLTGIQEVYFAYSNEDGEPFGLSTASLYEEMAKPLSQQSIKMEHRPVRSEDHLYAVWQRRRD